MNQISCPKWYFYYYKNHNKVPKIILEFWFLTVPLIQPPNDHLYLSNLPFQLNASQVQNLYLPLLSHHNFLFSSHYLFHHRHPQFSSTNYIHDNHHHIVSQMIQYHIHYRCLDCQTFHPFLWKSFPRSHRNHHSKRLFPIFNSPMNT